MRCIHARWRCAYRPAKVSQPAGPVSAAPPGFFRQKKANLAAGSEYEYGLFGVVCAVVLAAIAFSAVTIQVQAVVGETDTMTRSDFTLA